MPALLTDPRTTNDRQARRACLVKGLRWHAEHTFDAAGCDADGLAAEALSGLYDDVVASGAADAAEYREIVAAREADDPSDPLTWLDAEIGRYRSMMDPTAARAAEALQAVFDAVRTERESVGLGTPARLVASLGTWRRKGGAK